MILVKRLLLLASVLAGVFAVALPGPASAAGTPCRNKIFNNWYRDGKVASTYPPSCYRDALKHIPTDAGIYSSLIDDIHAALRAAISRGHGVSVPRVVGRGFKPAHTGVKARSVVVHNSRAAPHDPAVVGGTSLADTASGAPVPILVLGGIALALVAAGAIGVGVRHARGRGRP